MGLLYENILRPVLFKLDEEQAHELGIKSLKLLHKSPFLCSLLEGLNRLPETEPIELFGLSFPNAVGLAAGMDKDAECWRAMGALGFGHVEIGTVTYYAQPGNEKPRLKRFPKEEAIINRMGFNNAGAEAIAERLKQDDANVERDIPLGINIGKSKNVSLENATEDYLNSYNLLAEYADYFTINISSPNTPDLRKLQDKAYFRDFLKPLKDASLGRAKKLGQKRTPLLVKIAPDLTYREIDDILETILDIGMDGIIATNTTIDRTGENAKFLTLDRSESLATLVKSGGLSGKPLHSRAVKIVNYISRATEGKFPIIGVGGIHDPTGAGRMLDAGAHLIQIYTGFVYRGPLLAHTLARALAPRHRKWI